MKNPGGDPKGAEIETEGADLPEMKITRVPDASREDMLKAAGLDGSPRWEGVKRYGHGPDDGPEAASTASDVAWDDPDAVARVMEERGFLSDGGWHAVDFDHGRGEGLTSHVGIVHPDEYVNDDELIAMIEEELGFSYDQVRSVYRQGPKSETQRELRGQIDARLLALSHAGGILSELGRRLGFKVEADGHCEPFDNALSRAREAEKHGR